MWMQTISKISVIKKIRKHVPVNDNVEDTLVFSVLGPYGRRMEALRKENAMVLVQGVIGTTRAFSL